MARLRKLLGPKAMARINERACTKQEREKARQELPLLREAEAAAKQAMEKRRAELLADPEYVALRTAYQLATKEREHTASCTHSYRLVVGRNVSDMFFSVETEGDNWADVIAKLEAKKAKAAA